VVATASRVFTSQKYKLIEAAAGNVADAILAKFPRVKAVEVTIHKPHAPVAATFSDIAVTISRKR
jgi:7,8-dihydroneopterin aldolase/epimerase/oxygenase